VVGIDPEKINQEELENINQEEQEEGINYIQDL
jgi:hypothetical protein